MEFELARSSLRPNSAGNLLSLPPVWMRPALADSNTTQWVSVLQAPTGKHYPSTGLLQVRSSLAFQVLYAKYKVLSLIYQRQGRRLQDKAFRECILLGI